MVLRRRKCRGTARGCVLPPTWSAHPPPTGPQRRLLPEDRAAAGWRAGCGHGAVPAGEAELREAGGRRRGGVRARAPNGLPRPLPRAVLSSCPSPPATQAFYNLNPGGDIFNHANVHFWEYTQVGGQRAGLGGRAFEQRARAEARRPARLPHPAARAAPCAPSPATTLWASSRAPAPTSSYAPRPSSRHACGGQGNGRWGVPRGSVAWPAGQLWSSPPATTNHPTRRACSPSGPSQRTLLSASSCASRAGSAGAVVEA